MKKLLVAAIALTAASGYVNADDSIPMDLPVTVDKGTPENPEHVNIALATRVDYNQSITQEKIDPGGFYGRYLYLHIDGRINKNFDFHMRQCLNKFGDMKKDVFGATDWAYLDYNANDNITLSAGKQVVAYGGFEYDKYPIDVYYSSMFWQSIACFQFGASATWHFNLFKNRQHITAQVTNSPYCEPFTNRYSYNLMWNGRIGCFSALWSANLVEYAYHMYGRFVCLGNRFDFGHFYTEIDLMSRDWNKKFRLGNLNDDLSVVGRINYSLGHFDIFAKGGYEIIAKVPGFRKTIERSFYGGGIEYYPIKGNRNLRLHASANLGHEFPTGKQIIDLGVGVKWRVTLLSR